MNANVRRIALAVLATFSASGLAAERTTMLTWDCATDHPPSYREVAAFYEIQNPDQVNDARMSLHFTLQRACARGAQTVEIVRNDPSQPGTLRIVAR